jgi:flagellar brake protein
MPFMDTDPIVIDAIDPGGSWARFRIDDLRKRLALLRELRVGDTPVVVGAPNGPSVGASLWAVDDQAGRVHFSVDPRAPGLEQLIGLSEVWAAAYIGDVKLQFPVHQLALAASPMAAGLGGGARIQIEAALPLYLYRLPRRNTYRVRQNRHRGPRLRFRHPLAPDAMVVLAAMDVSLEGCALWKPASELPLPPGTLLQRVEVQLDSENFLFSDLVVQHVTLRNGDTDSGARIGCSWSGMHDAGRETLARWIRDNTRQRALIHLTLD